VGGLFLAILLTSCLPDRNVCTDLRDELKRCGFPIRELQCTRIDRTALEDVLVRLEERGCEGAASSDDRAVDPRLCTLGDWPCPSSPTPEPGPGTPRHPLVFVSGIDSTPIFDWNPRILEALRPTAAHHVPVLAWATVPERSRDLWHSLLSLQRHLGQTKLNLVCYAVSGLDCRYLVSPAGLFKDDPDELRRAQNLIASITTMATPHRGTRVAEAGIEALQSGTTADVLDTLLGSSAPDAVPDDAAVLGTLDGLTLDALHAFNREVTDADGIRYQSWAGVSHVLGRTSDDSERSIRQHCAAPSGELLFLRHPDTRDAAHPLLWATAPFSFSARNDQGRVITSPSDGMVSVASARWGEFRGCLPADHYDVIGQIGHTTRDPETGFDAVAFYRYLAADFAERGL
jgi:triacylglycerol lipase